MRALLLVLGFSLLFCFQLTAQKTGMVKGVVKDGVGQPQEFVNVVLKSDPTIGTTTAQDGSYSLNVPAGKRQILQFSHISFEVSERSVKVAMGKSVDLNVLMVAGAEDLEEVIIEDQSSRKEAGSVQISIQEGTLPDASGGVEGYLVHQGLGVQKSNELSSAYSVRGGNFDENLVYVNGFEVYRPFLIRSGQQEGLSFANPDLISNISFSSGGFQAMYGDKMSSVLDIAYKKPSDLKGSIEFSLLGGSLHAEGASKSKNFTYLLGVRFKTSRYLLGSLNTRGEYNPSFLDLQGYLTYDINENMELEWISNLSTNRYFFQPEERQTTFGVINAVLQLNMFFEGQENDAYRSIMNGIGFNHQVSDNLQLRWKAAHYQNLEQERFDIRGDYFIGEVETDFSDEEFGEVVFGLGVGTQHDWARNELESTIYDGRHDGLLYGKRHTTRWGVNYKREIISDKLNEWEGLDSAGYSLPYNGNEVQVFDILKSSLELKSNRFSGYLQDSWEMGDSSRGLLTLGGRFQYWDVNQEFVFTPRAQVSWQPKGLKKDIVFTGAAGLYYQPPFYREMRSLDGEVNLNLKAQKSAHFVLGMDYLFKAWKRDFKFVTEVYYKHMWDLVPYEMDNVLIRYFGTNSAKGYAAGIDFRLHGELVEGIDSWLSMSVMSTRENIIDDSFNVFLDRNGGFAGPFTSPDDIVDTIEILPGSIPRPTDQRFSFAIFFQDHLPGNENFKVHLNLLFGTGLPFGPPDSERYQDQLRLPAYRRVDIGFSALLYGRARRLEKNKKTNKTLNSIWASVEVFNLLGISNTVSYLWVKDFRSTTYAVPNFLTSRRINARFIVRFG